MINSKMISNNRGIVFVTTVMLLGVLVILGTTAYILTSSEHNISRNLKTSEMAFYDAEAGVHYLRYLIESGLEDSSYSFPADVDDTNAISSYSMPTTDYNFSYDECSSPTNSGDFIKCVGNNLYCTTVSGQSHSSSVLSKSDKNITVYFKRDTTFDFGMFACDKITMGNKNKVNVGNPVASIGTNGPIQNNGGPGTEIWGGEVVVGGGTPPSEVDYANTNGKSGEAIKSGTLSFQNDYIDCDPLNIGNDPDKKNPDNFLKRGDGDFAGYFTSGPWGNDVTGYTEYDDTDSPVYLDNIELKGEGEDLIINASAGPIDIYIYNKVDVSNKGEISIIGDNQVNIFYQGGPDQDEDFVTEGGQVSFNIASENFGFYSETSGELRMSNTSSTDVNLKGVWYAPNALFYSVNHFCMKDVILYAREIDLGNQSPCIELADPSGSGFYENTITFTAWYNHQVDN